MYRLLIFSVSVRSFGKGSLLLCSLPSRGVHLIQMKLRTNKMNWGSYLLKLRQECFAGLIFCQLFGTTKRISKTVIGMARLNYVSYKKIWHLNFVNHKIVLVGVVTFLFNEDCSNWLGSYPNVTDVMNLMVMVFCKFCFFFLRNL